MAWKVGALWRHRNCLVFNSLALLGLWQFRQDGGYYWEGRFVWPRWLYRLVGRTAPLPYFASGGHGLTANELRGCVWEDLRWVLTSTEDF